MYLSLGNFSKMFSLLKNIKDVQVKSTQNPEGRENKVIGKKIKQFQASRIFIYVCTKHKSLQTKKGKNVVCLW